MDLSMARKSVEKLYLDRCNVYEHKKVVAEDCSTSVEEVVVYENIPCKLSYQFTSPSKDGLGDSIVQGIKLFISPEIKIKAGSKIVVTRNNVSNTYKNSGESAHYHNHQEIKLELEEDKA